MSELGVEEVRRIAGLARIRMGREEEARLAGELRRLVEYVGRVAEMEGEGGDGGGGAAAEGREVEPAAEPLPGGFEANAPATVDGLLRVPAVLGRQPASAGRAEAAVEPRAHVTPSDEEPSLADLLQRLGDTRLVAPALEARTGRAGGAAPAPAPAPDPDPDPGSDPPWSWSARRVADAVRSREVSAAEVLDACLERIARVDPVVGAWLETWEGEARGRAREIDRRVAAGDDPGPLAGVPLGLKDNLSFAGHRMTCASRILEGYVAPYSATAVERAVAAGAVPVGRLNMDELGMGAGTEHSAFRTTRNPWDPRRVPGGSSGGPAAALAAGMVPLALGSDTGGSVRQPAAFCGVVGVKPTWGRVSRHGLAAFASSLDTVGPMARDVLDAARALTAVAGADAWDATADPRPVPHYETGAHHVAESAGRLRLGVIAELEREPMAPAARRCWEAALDTLAGLGCDVVEVSVPALAVAAEVYHLVAACEASSNLARLDGMRYGRRAAAFPGERGAPDLDELYRRSRGEGFGPEVRRRVLLGTFALSAGYRDAYYARARGLVHRLRGEMTAALSSVDLLVGPTTPYGAFPLGAFGGDGGDDPLALYEADVFTVPASLAGLPAVALPAGVDDDRLPLSLQVTGPAFGETATLGLALAFERARAG